MMIMIVEIIIMTLIIVFLMIMMEKIIKNIQILYIFRGYEKRANKFGHG